MNLKAYLKKIIAYFKKIIASSSQEITICTKLAVYLKSARQSQANLIEELNNFQNNLQGKINGCIVDDGSPILIELIKCFDDVIAANQLAKENCDTLQHFTSECISYGKLDPEIHREVTKIIKAQLQNTSLLTRIHEGFVQVCYITDVVVWNIVLIALGLYGSDWKSFFGKSSGYSSRSQIRVMKWYRMNGIYWINWMRMSGMY